MSKPIIVSDEVHRRLKVRASLLGMGLGEYVNRILAESLRDEEGLIRAIAEMPESSERPVFSFTKDQLEEVEP